METNNNEVNTKKKNNKAKIIGLIVVVVLVVILLFIRTIILGGIIFVSSGDTVTSAKFSKFCQEFGDYSLEFMAGPQKDVRIKYGSETFVVTEAQVCYEASGSGVINENDKIPNGFDFTDALTSKDIKIIDGYKEDNKLSNVKCYEIDDSKVPKYEKNHKFHGDNLGLETHFVTQDGFVFTLPGYPRTVDGEKRMYISNNVYYLTDDGFTKLLQAWDGM